MRAPSVRASRKPTVGTSFASLVLIASAGLGEEINADYIEGFIAANRRREMKNVLQLLFADPDLVLGLDRMQEFLASNHPGAARQFCVLMREALTREVLGTPVHEESDCVLEIKSRGELPEWLLSLLEAHNVQSVVDYSKFVMASRAVHGLLR